MSRSTLSRLASIGFLEVLLVLLGGPLSGNTSLEIGRDTRISFSANGPVVERPSLTFNPVRNEYLAAWVEQGGRIRTVRIDADTGAVSPVAFSAVGARSSSDVVYNPKSNEYYLIWQHQSDSTADSIFGSRLHSLGGYLEIDAVSDESGSIVLDRKPAIACNSSQNEVLVAWLANEKLVVSRIVPNVGVSHPKFVGWAFQSKRPALVYNPEEREYLVVWDNYEFINGVRQFEIWARRVDGDTGNPIGQSILVSRSGGFEDEDSAATHPSVAYNSALNEYFVVWQADDKNAGLGDGEFEIFGKIVSANATGNTSHGKRISFVGGTGLTSRDAYQPSVSYDANTATYVVAWYADDPDFGQANQEFEVYMTLLDAETISPRIETRRISDAGPTPSSNSDPGFDAAYPQIALDGNNGGMVVWWAFDRIYTISLFHYSDEAEIFGQRFSLPISADGFESGSISSWATRRPSQ